jgi:TolA-binding protein
MINFKPNSIIYFTDDRAVSIYLLKEGKIILSYVDVQSGEQIDDVITNGEFFGVKSGLIGLLREETAKVLVNSTVIEFTGSEFEALITKNTSILIKMLRVFSNQLRRVGKQVQSFVTNKVTTNLAADFFQIGDYYFKNRKYSQAITVYSRYIKYYPNERKQDAERALNTYGENGGPTPNLEDINVAPQGAGAESGGNTDNIEIDIKDDKTFYQAISFIGNNRYNDAVGLLKQVTKQGNPNIKKQAEFEIGRCYYFLKNYNQAIEAFSMLIKNYPDFNKLGEVFFYLGVCFKAKEEFSKASEFLKKVLTMQNVDDTIMRKAHQELKEI